MNIVRIALHITWQQGEIIVWQPQDCQRLPTIIDAVECACYSLRHAYQLWSLRVSRAMPHLHRFYIPAESDTRNEVVLSPDESHHAIKVVRLRVGDEVALFDGQGHDMHGCVTRVDRREVAIRIEDGHEHPPPAPSLTLAQAWLHQEKSIEFIVRHGTEIGVVRFVFFRADRSERAPKMQDKWQRLAIEACKQCGRLWLPEFQCAADLQAVLDAAQGDILVASMDAPPVPLTEAVHGRDTTLVIGPEGDFTDAETKLALEHGAKPISLGAATLRSEVAAIIGATLVQYHLGRLGPIPSPVQPD